MNPLPEETIDQIVNAVINALAEKGSLSPNVSTSMEVETPVSAHTKFPSPTTSTSIEVEDSPRISTSMEVEKPGWWQKSGQAPAEVSTSIEVEKLVSALTTRVAPKPSTSIEVKKAGWVRPASADPQISTSMEVKNVPGFSTSMEVEQRVKVTRSAESEAMLAAVAIGEPNVFATVDQAVQAARAAYTQYRACTLADRKRFIEAIRAYASQPSVLDDLAEATVAETGMGVAAHKRWKTEIAAVGTPGVEDLTAEAFTGDDGLTTVEFSPFGVIGAITPTTNPTATIINNAISMLAAGNTVVFSPHPRAKQVSIRLIAQLNRVLITAGAPKNLLVSIAMPGRPSTQALFDHPGIDLLVATGGAPLVKAAMKSGKKVIGAGAGNPPAVVDHTADIPHAAKCIVDGASFDNNLPCIAEKAVVAVDSVAELLMFNMEKQGAYRLRSAQALERLESLILCERGKGKAEWIGQSAASILQAIGVEPPVGVRLIVVEVGPSHPFIMNELMMPVLGLVRVRSVGAAIQLAVRIEGANRHTAVMHSRDVTALTAMGRAIGTTLFIKNGPSYAGLGMDGEGYPTFTIAGPTGEGLTTARSFSRKRRCTMVGNLHMG